MQSFQNLEVMKLLGAGQYGKVYEVRDITTGNIYAFKVSPDAEKEAAFLSLVSSYPNCDPNIACYYGYGSIPNSKIRRPGVLMEYIQGQTLRDLIETSRLSELTLRNLLVVILTILGRLHQRGIFHGDLHTENIIIQPDGLIKIIDLGESCINREIPNYSETYYCLDFTSLKYVDFETLTQALDEDLGSSENFKLLHGPTMSFLIRSGKFRGMNAEDIIAALQHL